MRILFLTTILAITCASLQAMERPVEAPPAYQEEIKLKAAQNEVISEELLPAVVSFNGITEEHATRHIGSDYEKNDIKNSKNNYDRFICCSNALFKEQHKEMVHNGVSKPRVPAIICGSKVTSRTIRFISNYDESQVLSSTEDAILAYIGGPVRSREVAVFSYTDSTKKYALSEFDKEALRQLIPAQRQFIAGLSARDGERESLLNDAEWKELNALPGAMPGLLKANLNLRSQAQAEHEIKDEFALLQARRDAIAEEVENIQKDREAERANLQKLAAEYQAKLAAVPEEQQKLLHEQRTKEHTELNAKIEQLDKLLGKEMLATNNWEIYFKNEIANLNLKHTQQTQDTAIALKRTETHRNILLATLSVGVIAGGIWLFKYWRSK